MMVFPNLFDHGQPPRPLRVLVADDNSDTAESLAQLLTLSGCEVDVAYEGFAVVPVAKRFGPDVCILDVKMPGINGWEIARRLRNGVGGKRMLLIAVTGVQGQESADNSADAGIDHHFVKPAAPADLLAELTAFAQESLLCPVDGT